MIRYWVLPVSTGSFHKGFVSCLIQLVILLSKQISSAHSTRVSCFTLLIGRKLGRSSTWFVILTQFGRTLLTLDRSSAWFVNLTKFGRTLKTLGRSSTWFAILSQFGRSNLTQASNFEQIVLTQFYIHTFI